MEQWYFLKIKGETMKKIISSVLGGGILTGLICILVSSQSPNQENYIMLFNLIPIFRLEEVVDGVIVYYQWGILFIFTIITLLIYLISTLIRKIIN